MAHRRVSAVAAMLLLFVASLAQLGLAVSSGRFAQLPRAPG